MDAKLIAKKTFTDELVSNTSFSTTKLGKHESTMELYAHDDGSYSIEWDIPSLDMGESIGFVCQDKTVTDYWGIMDMPNAAIDLLKANGFDCSELED